MSIELSLWALGGVAGLSLASTVVVAVKGLALQKRVAELSIAPAPAGDGGAALGAEIDGLGEQVRALNGLADRVQALHSDLGHLQGSLASTDNSVSGLADDVSGFRRDLENLTRRLEDSRPAQAAEPERRRSRFQSEMTSMGPINLNRRGQMMRMHRRGESLPAIASALGISQGEVKLTIRMQEMISELPDKENSHDRL